MARPRLEVADVFRAHGAAWRKANTGHVGLAQLKVMSAIEELRGPRRSAGNVEALRAARTRVASPTIPAATGIAPNARRRRRGNGSEDREAEASMPVPYYHVVASPCRLRSAPSRSRTRLRSTTSCSRTAAETLTAIDADPKHLGARVGLTAVLATPGARRSPIIRTSTSSFHGGGLSRDGSRWIACKPGFLLPVRVLSRLFPPPLPRRPRSPACSRPPRLLRRPRLACREAPLFDVAAPSHLCVAANGWSTPRGRSPGQRPFSPISPATPIASRSRIPV